VIPFAAPQQSLAALGPEAVAAVVAAASDIALVLDRGGVIRDLSLSAEELAREGLEGWLGRPWVDTVTPESRAKAEALLREAGGAAPGAASRRQINHPSRTGVDWPVLYCAVGVAENRVVALGRDLRAVAALQQRLVDAQQSMERDYARLRHAETRYRLLFHMVSEALLIVDAATRRALEANPAASSLLGEPASALTGGAFPVGLDAESTRGVEALLVRVQATGRSDDVAARSATSGRELRVSASLFRHESQALFLVRLSPAGSDESSGPRATKAPRPVLAEAVESALDAFVVTNAEGRIVEVNAAFLDLAQLATGEQARGESLERWLGRPGADLKVLIGNLREHGSIRLFPTTVRGEYGSAAEVEISAVSMASAGQSCFVFSIRNVGRRMAAGARGLRPRSIEQLTELVGRVPLKELVRESTDLIERLCIEAALELTGDNRSSAAEMLGLSRQSLYVKLRRYGLVDAGSDDETGVTDI